MTGEKEFFLTTSLRCRQSAAFQASPSFARKKTGKICRFQISNSYDFSFLFLFLYIQYAGFFRQQNAKAPLPAKTAGLQNKERNEHDGESVLCIEEIFLSSSLVYIIPYFPAGANFCRIFFRSCGRPGAAGGFSIFRNFCKKNKPCKACTAI